MNGFKIESEDEYPSYMNLSENFQPMASTPSYLNPPLVETPNIKVENETLDEAPIVTDLDLHPPLKEPKKRGRPKKVKEDGSCDNESPSKNKSAEKKLKHDSITDHTTGSVKKKRDRFNGMPEEEVLQRLLPDILAPNLEILIIGINPGLFAAYVGHHYAGPGNHFWKCLYLSGLIPEPMNAYDDFKLLKHGIGFTNICARTTRGISDLRRNEIREGGEILKKKILKYRPKIAVFNGKGIYEVFSNSKDFCIGKQPETVEGTDSILYVMPSSSARCAQLPRAIDKVPFYLGLKKLRDHIRGNVEHLDNSDVTFPSLDMKAKSEIKFEKDDESNECLSELTLEQIQMRSEYLEALAASAEGREIPAEKVARRRLKGGSDDEDSALNFEDEESSQSSCSSELQRASQSDMSSQGTYTLSKSLPGTSSFEVIPNVKEEPPFDMYDYGNSCHSPEVTQEREDQRPGSSLTPSVPSVACKSSPHPSPHHHLQVSTPAASSSSSPGPAYINYPPSTNVPVNPCPPSNVAGVGGHVAMGTWQQNSTSHSYLPTEMNNEGMPRHPMSTYMPPAATSQHPSPMHYHMHSSANPYHPGAGPMPVSSPLHSVGHPPGQFKGRPPRHQWSNGSSGHMMMGPGMPAGGNNYPYMYGRGGCLPYQGSGFLKGAPNMSSSSSSSSPSPSSSSPQRNSMDKNVKGGASYPPSHLPNFFTC